VEVGPHLLSYRQTERTCALLARALAKDKPDGRASDALQEVLDQLLKASVQVAGEPASSSYAVDWTDLQTRSRPPPAHGGECSDPEAAWGRRHGQGRRDEPFLGYYLQAVTLVRDEAAAEVPELVRRIHLASCKHDPPAALVPVIERMRASGIDVGDLLADSGYSYRVAETWALPLRRLKIELVQDLHPNHRGPRGTHMGAILANGSLYCPATPPALPALSPLAPGANEQQVQAHDQKSQELSKYKLAPITGYDDDGFRRVGCPAAQGKVRCPLRPESMTRPHDRPQVLSRPSSRPPAADNAPSPCHRPSTPRPPKSTTTPPGGTGAPTRAAPPPSAPTRRSSPGSTVRALTSGTFGSSLQVFRA